MSSAPRLTKYAREEIARKVITHAFLVEEEALAERLAKLANAIRNDVVGVHAEFVENAPKGFFREEKQTRAIFDGKGIYLEFSGRLYRGGYYNDAEPLFRPEVVHKRIPHQLGEYGGGAYPRGHDFTKTWSKLSVDIADYYERRKEEWSRVSGVLESFSSYKKLLDGWPEIAAFVDVPTVDKSGLPAPLINSLNAALKLPPAEKAKEAA